MNNPKKQIVHGIITARKEKGLTQVELARRMGTRQSNISRLEGENYNPSLEFLNRVAKGLGKELHIEFKDREDCGEFLPAAD